MRRKAEMQKWRKGMKLDWDGDGKNKKKRMENERKGRKE